MTYSEKLDILREEVMADLIKIHELLIEERGEPPMLIYKKFPERRTNLFDMPVKEYKTFLNKFTFKLSAIGINKNGDGEFYYIRGFSTAIGYKRLKFQDVEFDMLVEFVDHLKNFYN